MFHPASTGQVARLLDTTEPRLNDLIRRAKVHPPPVRAGRRLWTLDHILQAATVLGLSTDAIRHGVERLHSEEESCVPRRTECLDPLADRETEPLHESQRRDEVGRHTP